MTDLERQTLSSVTSGSNWFPVPRDYLQVLPPDEASLLFHLINVSQMEDSTFIRIPVLTLQKTFPLWGKKSQQRILKRLEQRGLISIEMRGFPPD